MPFKVKAYPFPVLTSSGTSYNSTSKFTADLVLDLYDSNGNFSPSIAYDIALVNDKIVQMVAASEAEVFLELFAKETLTRRLIPASIGRGISQLVNLDLAGTVQVTPLVVSRLHNPSLVLSDIAPEYGSSPKFEVLIGDPLAIAQTEQFEVNMDHQASPDMLTIKRVKGTPDDYYDIATDGNTITLSLSEKMKEIWEFHYKDSSKKPYLFIGLYRQCMEVALADLLDNGIGERQWAKTLSSALDARKVKLQTTEDVATAARILVFPNGYERVYNNVFAE